MKKISIITGCCLLLSSAYLHAANPWIDTNVPENPVIKRASDVRPFPSRKISADLTGIRQALSSSVSRKQRAKGVVVNSGFDIPLPDGDTEKFSVEESPIMLPELANKFPEIKTYKVRGIDTPSSNGRVDVTPNGFHAYINTQEGLVIIDPVISDDLNSSAYHSYYKSDFVKANSHLAKDYACGVSPSSALSNGLMQSPMNMPQPDNRLAAKTAGGLQRYELAISATQQYVTKVAGANNVAGAVNEIATAINRVNQIFNRDLAIHLMLIDNTGLLNIIDEDDNSLDGKKDLDMLIDENQFFMDSRLANSDYDVGHIFATVGGGLAALGSTCFNGFKAQGASGLPNKSSLTSDAFYIDIVAHELGHQFGANHSFNATSGACDVINDFDLFGPLDPRNQATAFEPGSGNTIMAYAGICTGENIQTFADANFHAGSIDEIVAYTRINMGSLCDTPDGTVNSSPIVNAGQDFVIPLATPFTLSGAATDPESDPLTFQWQQMDTGTATDATTFGTDLGDNPLFKSFPSVNTGSRTFPQMSTLLAQVTDPAEVLPTKARTMNFRLLVKDGNGGVDSDDIKVRATSVAGPFRVLQPNTAITLDITQPQIVEWDSACTDQAPVDCATVDIFFSDDGGTSFTPLVLSTPNDGEATVNNMTQAANARLKIMCSDNVFFDVSDVNFSTSATTGATLTATGNGGNSGTCAVEPVATKRSSGGSINGLFLLSFSLLAGFRFRRSYSKNWRRLDSQR